MLTNLDLIREFIKLSIQRKEVLLANQILKAETVYSSNNLAAKAEGTIVTTKFDDASTSFLIKANSTHWELINQVLAEYNFILTGNIDHRGFYQYQYCQAPEGYQMHCSKAVVLWRSWWKHRKYVLGRGIPLELLIRIRHAKRHTWYPIKDLIISDGVLYIKTLGSEIAVHSDDLITWLSKVEDPSQTQA
ncbi:hypothetical protein QUB80_08510 [Chlorogloeopsis sp. ULAP01]|uniref:hypothetical protein n=1 Tax=Chlorogloeopsis sp. ULAP01 TaxID=3056483 RepID=UPI0025AA83FB|nr:hypothetical protein [Chlorogloeopsis sp. ULAP01]MDM9380747.1 hypothetical protein [Chlorogloeopsis sp. ULAP01]